MEIGFAVTLMFVPNADISPVIEPSDRSLSFMYSDASIFMPSNSKGRRMRVTPSAVVISQFAKISDIASSPMSVEKSGSAFAMPPSAPLRMSSSNSALLTYPFISLSFTYTRSSAYSRYSAPSLTRTFIVPKSTESFNESTEKSPTLISALRLRGFTPPK